MYRDASFSASFPSSDLEEVMSHMDPRKEDVMPGYSDCNG